MKSLIFDLTTILFRNRAIVPSCCAAPAFKFSESLLDASVVSCNQVNMPKVHFMDLAEFRHNRIVQSPNENYFKIYRQHKEK